MTFHMNKESQDHLKILEDKTQCKWRHSANSFRIILYEIFLNRPYSAKYTFV